MNYARYNLRAGKIVAKGSDSGWESTQAANIEYDEIARLRRRQ